MRCHLHQPEVEATVLAAIICEPRLLDLAPDLEVWDFSDLRNQAVFSAIRDIQAVGGTINVIAVDDRLEELDKQHETNLLLKAGAGWIGILICDSKKHFNDEHFLANLRHLRRVVTDGAVHECH